MMKKSSLSAAALYAVGRPYCCLIISIIVATTILSPTLFTAHSLIFIDLLPDGALLYFSKKISFVGVWLPW